MSNEANTGDAAKELLADVWAMKPAADTLALYLAQLRRLEALGDPNEGKTAVDMVQYAISMEPILAYLIRMLGKYGSGPAFPRPGLSGLKAQCQEVLARYQELAQRKEGGT